MKLVIAIDGPAGTGKSSVARLAAQNLGLVYVETGALYRALAYVADKNHVAADDVNGLLALMPKLSVVVDEKALCTRIVVDKKVVESELRCEKISRLSSIVSQHKSVRDAMLQVQRGLVDKVSAGAIFEGRDIGTVVFPKAPLKIFVTASPQTRAERRFEQIKLERPDITLAEILDGIKVRDDRDKNRPNSPLQKADDAVIIDTSHMSLDEVLQRTIALIKGVQEKSTKGSPLW